MKYFSTLFLLLLLFNTFGCVSGTLPPPLSTSELHILSENQPVYTVGVEAYHWRAYSDGLVSSLRSTNVFSSVVLLDDCKTPPDIIARVEEPYNGGVATIPIWTILTLGIVPTVVQESFGYDFSLQFRNDGARKYNVRYVCRSITTGGWIALVEALSPDVTLGCVECSKRFNDRLALAILNKNNPTTRR
jgi:hypothetical protein